jgi:hypothetical protein
MPKTTTKRSNILKFCSRGRGTLKLAIFLFLQSFIVGK